MLTLFANQLLQEISDNNLIFSAKSSTQPNGDQVKNLVMQDIISTAMTLNQADNLSACDASLKQTLSHYAINGYRINFKGIAGCSIKSIRILAFNGFNSQTRMLMMRAPLNYYLSMTRADGKKCRMVVKDDSQLSVPNLITEFLKECPTDRLEVVVPKTLRMHSQPLPSGQWAEMYHDNDGAVTKYYQNVNDPILIPEVEKALKERHFREKPLILELGGGRGRVAEQILALSLIKKLGCQYVLVEPCADEIHIAKKLLHESCHKLGIENMVDIITIHAKASPKVLSNFYGKADLVISSGGPLNDQIVSLEEASQTAEQAFRCLVPSGRLLSVGLTFNLLSKKDYERYGFEVTNMSSRVTSDDFFDLNKGLAEKRQKTELLQLYSMRKPQKKSLLSTEWALTDIPTERSELPSGMSQQIMTEGVKILSQHLPPLKKINFY